MSKHVMIITIPFEAESLVEIGKAAAKLEEEVDGVVKSHPGTVISYRQTRTVAERRPGVRRGRQRGAAAE